jgi:hypothetical protein
MEEDVGEDELWVGENESGDVCGVRRKGWQNLGPNQCILKLLAICI